jgi:hypothetical protein
VAAKTPRRLLDLLRRYDPPVQEIVLATRALLHDELAPCREYVYDMRSKLVLLYSATPRVLADGICQLPVFVRHVTLVFPQGAELDDPSGVLRGTGKIMRHVRLDSRTDVEQPELRALLRQARQLTGLAPRERNDTQTILTSYKTLAPSRKRAPRDPAFPDRLF